MTELPFVRVPRVPVTDSFHGVDVTEDYRWLEDASADATVAWTRAQQDRTATYFGEVGWRAALRARVEQLLRFERTA
jgi:prolyl oligopeptidase